LLTKAVGLFIHLFVLLLMRLIFGVIGFWSLALVAGAGSLLKPPTGVYRSAAQYHRSQPAPAGDEIRLSDKRQGVIVTQEQGGRQHSKVIVPLDSVWGYVNGKGVGYRLFRGEEYKIETVDTLAIYSSAAPNRNAGSNAPAVRTYMADQYFFSRGLNGLIFPLSEKYLRLAYAASNPAFVAAVQKLGVIKSLSDYDKKTGTFRVTQLYRDAQGK
jgi:hypothetical protein